MERLEVLGLGIVAIIGAVLVAGPRTEAQDAPGDRGLELYAKYCSICHGERGRGDGSASYLLSPKPRDFGRGEFRLVTTTNTVPTDNDLLRAITNGMPGSGMPPWDRLSEADRRLLVRAVKDLWRAGLTAQYREQEIEPAEIKQFIREDTTPGPVVSFEGEGEPTVAAVARGRIVYSQACASCHGAEGRGETEKELLDSRGFPAPARDFTKGIFKGGSEARQLYARLRAGMKGTAMPTYLEDTLTQDEAWAVVHYIRTLFPPVAQDRQQQRTLTLKIHRRASLPATPAAWWNEVPLTYVALMPLWWRDRRVEGLLVQAAHDGKTLAMRLSWEDATEDLANLGQNQFHDGAAVQLSWDESPPFFGMGDASSTVLIWSWKASWEADAATGFRDIESIYPHMNLDTYFPVQKNLQAGDRPARDKVGARFHDPRYLTGWGSGNPIASPDRPSAVEVARAQGQGTLTTQEREAHTVKGESVWDRGIWTLVIHADLPPERCRRLFAAFAVWDGTQKDRNGQKSVSIWHRLELE